MQYKIIHRILGVKYLLAKMKITNTSLCSFCGNQNETIQHLFYDCDRISELWENIRIWIRQKINIELNLNKLTVIMGYLNQDNHKIPINFLLLNTKAYIFYCSRKNKIPNIQELQKRIKNSISEERMLSKLRIKEWHLWEKIVENI